MARTAMTGWEWGYAREGVSTLSTSGVGAGATVSSIAARSGAFGLRLLAGAAGVNTSVTSAVPIGGGSDYWRLYFRLSSATAGTSWPFMGTTGAGVFNARIEATSGSAFTLTVYSGTTLQATVAALSFNTWYRLEAQAGNRVRLDGSDIFVGSVGSMSIDVGQASSSTAYEVHLDDFVADDANWPGEGKVALLLPASQNSVTASTWQKPGGATTNMHTSVDNVPPVGVADSTNVAQAENQIRNAVSNATADVVFAMQTYAAAGISAPTLTTVSHGTGTSSQNSFSDPSHEAAQSFTATASGLLSSLSLYLIRTGSPSDNLSVEIREDNAGDPTGSVLSSGLVSAASVPTSSANVTVSMSPASLVSGTLYWIRCKRTGTIDNSNLVSWQGDNPGTYGGGSSKAIWPPSFPTWTASAADHRFAVVVSDGAPQDTINAVQAFAITAAPVSTGAVSGSLETTNPAQAEVNFGQFYSGVNAGTFPTGWQRRNHTITQTPTVTLGTAPTVELGKRTASTRIGMVSLVGMYVDYTPAAAPPPAGDVFTAYVGGGYYG